MMIRWGRDAARIVAYRIMDELLGLEEIEWEERIMEENFSKSRPEFSTTRAPQGNGY